jgi:hypothetical protein
MNDVLYNTDYFLWGFLKKKFFHKKPQTIKELRALIIQAGRGLATSWSPAQGVLPNVQDLENWSETESFTEEGQGPNWGCSAIRRKN